MIAAAKGNRHGHRDATMILVAFRHGRTARRPSKSAQRLQSAEARTRRGAWC